MKRTMLAGVIVVGVICGCVPSIHGIATKENTIWDDDLLGVWGEPNDPNKTEMWRFDKGAEKEYGLIYVDSDGKIGKFDTVLVKLGEDRYLDIYPKDLDDGMNGFYKVHWVPAHTFVKVDETGETLRVRMMDPDKVKKMLEKQPVIVKHEVVDNAVLLTAGTKELQEFLKRHADDIWGQQTVLVSKGPKR